MRLTSQLNITQGVPTELFEQSLTLYDSALQQTDLGQNLKKAQRLQLLKEVIDLRFAFAAVHGKTLVGLAGFQTASGSFTGASNPKRLYRALGLKIFTRLIHQNSNQFRTPRSGEMLHNGLVTHPEFRRCGIAQHLLGEIAQLSKQLDKQCLRLDASLKNKSALSLYKKSGYIPESVQYQKADTILTLRKYL